MTIFDTETDGYLDRLGASHSSAGWTDVVERAKRARRRSRVTRAAVGVGAAATAAAVALAAVGALGGPGSTSIVDKAEAAVLAPVQAAPGTIEHILVQYAWIPARRSSSTKRGLQATARPAVGRWRACPARQSRTRG